MMGKPISITPELVAKVRMLREYGLTLKQVSVRLGIAESSAHKLYHAKGETR